MITILPQSSDRIIGLKLTGKLHDEDYEHFVPRVEAAIQEHGKVRLLVHFEDFHGWDLHAIWDDTKFSVKHCLDIEKVAIVGDRAWEKGMAVVCKPFTTASVKFFETTDIEQAWVWIAE